MLIKIDRDACFKTINSISNEQVKKYILDFFMNVNDKVNEYNSEPENNCKKRYRQLKEIEVLLSKANVEMGTLGSDSTSLMRANAVIEHIRKQFLPCLNSLKQCEIENGLSNVNEMKEPTQLEKYLSLQTELFKTEQFGVKEKFEKALEKIKEFASKNFGAVLFLSVCDKTEESSPLNKWIPQFFDLLSSHLKLVGMANNNYKKPNQTFDYAERIQTCNFILFCGTKDYSNLANKEQLQHFYAMIDAENKKGYNYKIIIPMLISGTQYSSFLPSLSNKECIVWNACNSNSYFENIRTLIKTLYLNSAMLYKDRSEELRDALEKKWDNHVDEIWKEFLNSIPENRIPVLLGSSEALEGFLKEKNEFDKAFIESRNRAEHILLGLPVKTQASVVTSIVPSENKTSADKKDAPLRKLNPATLFAPDVNHSKPSDGPEFVVNVHLFNKQVHKIIDEVLLQHDPATIVKSYYSLY